MDVKRSGTANTVAWCGPPVAFVTGTAIIALTTHNRRNGDVGQSGDDMLGRDVCGGGRKTGCGSESRGCVKIAFVAAKGGQEA